MPSDTRCGGKWILLNNALKARSTIQRVLLLGDVDAWRKSLTGAAAAKAEKIFADLGDNTLWDDAEALVDLLRPAYVLMKICDSSSDAISWVYGFSLRMQKKYEQLKTAASKRASSRASSKKAKEAERRASEVFNAWTDRWANLHSPLHSLAYLLNPAFTIDRAWEDQNEDHLRRGDDARTMKDDVNLVLEKYFADGDGSLSDARKMMKKKAYFNIAKFQRGELTNAFRGTPQEQRDHILGLTLDELWAELATEGYADLAPVARRVLAQVVSASACERVWSRWGWIESKLRNRLLPEKTRKLVCIHAAIRLAEIQKTVAPGDGRSRKLAEDDEFMD